MQKIVQRIPGGWFGNDPGSFDKLPKAGNVVVDVRRLKDAMRWLQRRANILATSVFIGQNNNHGVQFDYELK